MSQALRPPQLPCRSPCINFAAYYWAGVGATNQDMGVELWRSDGTDEGTVLVKDTHAGADSYISSDLVDVNGMIFFITYSPGSGYELWQSDGTEGGTVLIKGGFGWSSVDPKIAVDGVLFFRAGSAL